MFRNKLYFEYLECARPGALGTPYNTKNVLFRDTESRNAKQGNLFHFAQKHVHQTSKKKLFCPVVNRSFLRIQCAKQGAVCVG